MIPTLSTLVTSSLNALTLLTPVEVVFALAAVFYAVGGLVALRIVDGRSRAVPDPAHASRPSYPPFKAAA